MSIELKQAAQQAIEAFDAFGDADDFATLFALTQKMNALRTAIQQAGAKVDEPAAWLNEMLADTKDVFDANGTETPQVVRDVIEYVASWINVYNEKRHPAPGVPDGYVPVPLQVLRDASEALGNFVSDHGWGDADMQAMDNLDAYIARHDAKAKKGQP